MAHKYNDRGSGYEIGGIKGNDNGTVYNIDHGNVNVNGTVYKIGFSRGNPVSELSVGSIVKMKVNGVAREFIVVHQGKPSSLYDDSCNGTWLLMKDVYENRAWNGSASNIYAESAIHAYLNGDFLNLLDAGIRAKIKTVKIPFVNGTGRNGKVASGANGLSTRAFLLGSYEVGWTKSINTIHPEDGACLSYFSGTAATDSKRIAMLNGAANGWYLRSPGTMNATYAIYVTASGGSSTRSVTNTATGIRPAFIIPSDATVDDNFNLIA